LAISDDLCHVIDQVDVFFYEEDANLDVFIATNFLENLISFPAFVAFTKSFNTSSFGPGNPPRIESQ
jgi:hypothetical protein